MTTPKEALRPFAACIFNDNGDITIDTSHLRTEDYMRAKSALASIQGEDAVERVKALAHRFWSIHPSTIAAMNLTREEFYAREMMALLATGLVPDEAAVRADEREKCAKVAEAECYATTGRQIAAAIRSGGGQ